MRELIGKHRDTANALVTISAFSAKTFDLSFPKDLSRSGRLKVACGAKWHPETLSWRVSARSKDKLAAWLEAEMDGSAAKAEADAQAAATSALLAHELIGQHGDITVIAAAPSQFGVRFARHPRRSDRLKAATGASWVSADTAWHIHISREAQLRQWLTRETDGSAADQDEADALAIFEADARAKARCEAIEAAAKAKVAAERPVMDRMLAQLASATKFATLEAKKVIGVGGDRPTAVATDIETGIEVSVSRLLKITERRKSGSVILYDVEIPKADGIEIVVNYWWNRDRTYAVGG
jgi:hypothetical protein